MYYLKVSSVHKFMWPSWLLTVKATQLWGANRLKPCLCILVIPRSLGCWHGQWKPAPDSTHFSVLRHQQATTSSPCSSGPFIALWLRHTLSRNLFPEFWFKAITHQESPFLWARQHSTNSTNYVATAKHRSPLQQHISF